MKVKNEERNTSIKKLEVLQTIIIGYSYLYIVKYLRILKDLLLDVMKFKAQDFSLIVVYLDFIFIEPKIKFL